MATAYPGSPQCVPRRIARTRLVRLGRGRHHPVQAHRLPRACDLAVCALFVLLLGLGGIGCQGQSSVDPLAGERVVSIDLAALSPFLEQTTQLAGTPAARYSRQLLDLGIDCDELWGRLESSEDSTNTRQAFELSNLDCRNTVDPTDPLLHVIRERRGDADGFIAWPIAESGRIEMRLRVDAGGSVDIDGEVIAPLDPGALRLLIPGADPPAASVINSASALVHLRMRPAEGIGLSNLIPAGSQADRLFALKGRLLEGALLSGTWELAFMPPAADGEVPMAVGALHHRLDSAIEEALNEALSQLESTWPIRRSPRRFTLPNGSTVEGGCFLELPLLPELAPCWVVTPEALLMGYRGDAIDKALAMPDVASSAERGGTNPSDVPLGPSAPGRLDVHLDRMARVDEALPGIDTRFDPGAFFSKFELRMGTAADGRIKLQARLRRRS